MNPTTGMAGQAYDPRSRAGEAFSDGPLVALHEVVQAVAREADLQATLSLVAEKARALTGAASAAVTLLDKTRSLLDFAAVAGVDAAEIVGQTVRVEDALAGQTALTGELYLAHNPTQSRPLLATLDPDLARGWGVHSAAVVPIYLAGRPAGALAAINREDNNSFGGSDVLRLQLLANTVALALSMDGLRRQTAQKQRERDILYDAARTTSSSLNVQEVLSSVLATVSDSLEMTAGAVFLLNDERTRLYIGADRGLSEEERDRQLAADSGLAAHLLASGQPYLISDALQSETPDDMPLLGMRALMAAPMMSRSSAEGLLVVGSRQANAYTPADAQLLSAVASQAAVALENAWLYEDATRRAEEATAIYELSQAVGATLHLDRVLDFVADSVLALLQVDKFALFLYETRSGRLEIKIARNIRPEATQTIKPRPGEGIAGWVLEFETPTAVQDVSADHRNRSCPIDTEGVNSLVSVPLQSGDRVIGVLHAMSSRRRLFTVGEMELLYTIANQVGAAVANAQIYEDARQKSEEIRSYVRRVARALGSSLNGQETAQVIADLAVEVTGADRSVLFMLDSQGRLRPRTANNFRAALGQDVVLDDTPAAWVARRGRTLSVENFAQDPRFSLPPFAARERVAGYLGVPLKLGKTVLGVLEVYTREPRHFTADMVRLLLTFASQASVGLQNALLVEQANRRLADLQVLEKISERLDGPLSDLYGSALPLLAEAAQADEGLLVLFGDPADRYLFPVGGLPDKGGERSLDELAAWVQSHEESLSAADPPPAGPFPLAVPLAAGAGGRWRVQGALVLRRSVRPFDTYDRQLVRTVAHLLSSRLPS